MEPDVAMDLARRALMITLLISAPLLLIGLVVGVLISIFQAVTQIQEMTLTFVPKSVIMALAAAALLPWMMKIMLPYAAEMFGPMLVP